MWLIISIIVRVLLVAFLIGTYTTMLVRIKHGFTKTVAASNYIVTMVIVGTLLYVFQFILPV